MASDSRGQSNSAERTLTLNYLYPENTKTERKCGGDEKTKPVEQFEWFGSGKSEVETTKAGVALHHFTVELLKRFVRGRLDLGGPSNITGRFSYEAKLHMGQSCNPKFDTQKIKKR